MVKKILLECPKCGYEWVVKKSKIDNLISTKCPKCHQHNSQKIKRIYER
ncbi:MAG: hypothetical protein ACOCP8_03355 [archaeon]